MTDNLVVGHKRTLTLAYHTQQSLTHSKRWVELVEMTLADLPVLAAVSKVGPMAFSQWSDRDIVEVIDWAEGRVSIKPIPKVLSDYIELLGTV